MVGVLFMVAGIQSALSLCDSDRGAAALVLRAAWKLIEAPRGMCVLVGVDSSWGFEVLAPFLQGGLAGLPVARRFSAVAAAVMNQRVHQQLIGNHCQSPEATASSVAVAGCARCL